MIHSGLSDHRLGRLHDVLARHVEQGHAPGLVAVVSRRGRSHIDAIGAIDLAGSRSMQFDSIVRISSMTKPVTAVAALILLEECVLRLVPVLG
jgi:CubicO group peptidase (beta-lactamase class C family)